MNESCNIGKSLLRVVLALAFLASGGWLLGLVLDDLELLSGRSWAPLAGGVWLAYLGLSVYLWRLAGPRPWLRALIGLPVVGPPLLLAGLVFGWPPVVGLAGVDPPPGCAPVKTSPRPAGRAATGRRTGSCPGAKLPRCQPPRRQATATSAASSRRSPGCRMRN